MTALFDVGQDNLSKHPLDPAHPVVGRSIARHLVHCFTSEVLITSLSATGDMFRVGARWPCELAAFSRCEDLHDPMLLVETVRQAGLAIAHTFFAVPRQEKIIWHDISYTVMASGMRWQDQPVELELRVEARDVRRRGARVVGMKLAFSCLRDGELIASGETTWATVSSAAYARLRGSHFDMTELTAPLALAIAPERVGKACEAEVLVADTPAENVYVLRLDPENRTLFDHPNDHVSGIVVAQAARQAAVAALGRPDAVPVRGDLDFSRYVELDTPCVVTVVRQETYGDTHEVVVTLAQAGYTAVTCRFDLLFRG